LYKRDEWRWSPLAAGVTAEEELGGATGLGVLERVAQPLVAADGFFEERFDELRDGGPCRRAEPDLEDHGGRGHDALVVVGDDSGESDAADRDDAREGMEGYRCAAAARKIADVAVQAFGVLLRRRVQAQERAVGAVARWEVFEQHQTLL
jgi:hypothetical protein